MMIKISGKNMDVGDALRQHVEARLEEGTGKYFDRITSLDVVFTKNSHLFDVQIHGNVETRANIMIKSRGEATDVYAAFDDAASKIEKQLRRYKRRLTNHHNPKASMVLPAQAVKYVIRPEAEADELPEEAQPAIVAEKTTHLDTLTVGEAVMRMDLADLPALMFRNASNGRLNVVYRRADGNISWVDPNEQQQTNVA